jgi:hypothetical protein
VNVILPVNFEESVPPKVSLPFLTELASVPVGSKETETRLAEMVPWLKRLSVTVGILSPIDGDSEPIVRFVGPILRNRCQNRSVRTEVHAHPRMPSTSLIPREVEATPMDCEGMTTPGAIVTVSVNSVPGCGYKDRKDGTNAGTSTKEYRGAIRHILVDSYREPVLRWHVDWTKIPDTYYLVVCLHTSVGLDIWLSGSNPGIGASGVYDKRI